MQTKMKVRKNFSPTIVDEGDELYPNGIFEFNITKLLAFITSQPEKFAIESVALKELGHSFNTLDESTIATANLNSPIILAEIRPGRFEVIDGNHRVEKARRIGAKSILAYRVGPDVHHQFFTSERAYRIYVEYWNSKLKELGQLAKL